MHLLYLSVEPSESSICLADVQEFFPALQTIAETHQFFASPEIDFYRPFYKSLTYNGLFPKFNPYRVNFSGEEGGPIIGKRKPFFFQNNGKSILEAFTKYNQAFLDEMLPQLKKLHKENQRNPDFHKFEIFSTIKKALSESVFCNLLNGIDPSAPPSPIDVLERQQLGTIVNISPDFPVIVPINTRYSIPIVLETVKKPKIHTGAFLPEKFFYGYLPEPNHDEIDDNTDLAPIYQECDSYANSLYFCGKYSQLSPICAHLLRLLYIMNNLDQNSSQEQWGPTDQITMTLHSLGTLLFPYFEIFDDTLPPTFRFANLCFQKFYDAYLRPITNQNNHESLKSDSQISQDTAVFLFGMAMEKIIQDLSEEEMMEHCGFSKELQHFEWTNPKIIARQLLLNPDLQKKMPVIDAFLRLNENFERIKFLPTIARPVAKLLTKIQNLDDGFGSTIIRTIPDLDEDETRSNDFLAFWVNPAQTVFQDYISRSLRLTVDETINYECTVQSFLPHPQEIPDQGSEQSRAALTRTSLEQWNVLNVLVSCTEAQNEFVSILQENAPYNMVIEEIPDTQILDANSVQIDRNQVMEILMNVIGPSISSKNGLPVLEEKHEREFIDRLRGLPFCYILHQSLAPNMIIMKANRSLVGEFAQKLKEAEKRTRGQMVLQTKLTQDQKQALEEIAKKGHSQALVKILCEIMERYTSKADANEQHVHLAPKTLITKFIEDELLATFTDPAENGAYEILATKQSFLVHDKFMISQIPALYSFLTKPNQNTEKEKTGETNVDEIKDQALSLFQSLLRLHHRKGTPQ